MYDRPLIVTLSDLPTPRAATSATTRTSELVSRSSRRLTAPEQVPTPRLSLEKDEMAGEAR